MNIAVFHRYPMCQVVGTNASFPTFIEELIKRGHAVFFITHKDPSKPKPTNGLNYRELPYTFFRGNRWDKLVKTLLWMILAPLKAWKMSNKDKIDLFYCDDSLPYYGYFTKLLVGGKKVIIRLGDLQSGYIFSGKGLGNKILFKIFLSLEKIMWKKIDGLIPISKQFAHFLINEGIDKEKISIVEESIDLEYFTIKNKNTQIANYNSKNHPLIMFHGALLPCKGLVTFINAIPIILKEIPSAVFIIAGGGSEEYKLKKISQKLIKNKKLIFTGWYDHKIISQLLSTTDIGIVMRSSNMANNFVVTTCLLEYWASKKPVIVPRLTAISAIVKDKYNGMVFIPDDANNLAQKTIYLLKNRVIWKELGEKGWNTARRIFNKDLIGEKLAHSIIKHLE